LGALSVPPAGTYDVLFTPVEGSVTVTPGATEIFISARDTDGDDLPCMQYSLDGEHYTTSNYIGGLEPDTDYMLYVRQGTNAWYYTQLFHTAAVDYGVRVGRVPVTDKNLGNLDMLGWEFDPDSRTLYLDRLWWRDTGTPCSSEQVFYVEATARALIYSSGDLTVHLFGNWGDTTLERIPEAGDWFANYTVYAEGDLTIQGSGSLVINGDNTADFAFGSGTGDITLNLGGTLTVNCGNGFYVPNGQLIYRSGDIAFNSYVRTVGYNDLQVCNFIPRDQLSSFKLYPEHGTMRYEVAGLDGVRTEVDEDGLLEQLDANYEAWQTKRSVYITPTHTYDQQVSTMEYWEDGECGGSVTYHYSCCCGASGAETYTVNQAEHDLVHCAGDPPTCEHGGYYDYDRCTKCAYYGTFHYYPQGLGHDWTHYDPEWPTCTEDGHPAYEVCQRCGASTAVEMPTDEELALGLGDTGLATWKATGHTYRYVGAQNATCTQDGHPACYVCDNCGEYFAHQDDVVPMDPAEVVIPAAGHSWGFPEVTPATPTANGARTARCLLCGEAGETTVIPRIDWIELSDYTCYYDGTPKEPAV
ncbi:MAG: hypothetical protein IJL08_06065, partial [Oscillospiraceae bacterium]|nr:hypothetical protein [Oscillospiraceae bacterium]